jgi:diketogulonate reductase-like aldo/keto reductase
MLRERMEESFNVVDFELSAEEIASIDALDKGEGGRIG